MAAISQSLQKNLIFGLSPPKASAFPRGLPLTKIGKAWLVPALFLLATAAAVKAGDYRYTTNSDNTITITRYRGDDREVIIPSEIDGMVVSKIRDFAFGSHGLWDATSMDSVTIPDSVTSIEHFAFYNCWGQTSFVVDEDNSVYSSVDGVLFNKSQTKLIQYPQDRTGSYTIPDGVIRIGANAFNKSQYSGTPLTGVTIPDSLTSIGSGAFWGCDGLTSVTIPNSVTSIGASAFERTGLTGVTIPNSITRIEDAVFHGCYSLTSVTIPDSVTRIGDRAFSSTHLTSVTIPNSVTSIGASAFALTELPDVTIPYSVTTIGSEAFEWCFDLTAAYFWGNAPSIGSDIFDRDDSVIVYYLPWTTGWGSTFGNRPTMPMPWWWDGPQISVNGTREDVTLNRGDAVRITVALAAGNYSGRPLDWWIIARAGSAWSFLNNAGQWIQYDGSFSNCRPVYQGELFNLPAMEVLNTTDLATGSYTFWFVIDYPMDGILNLGGYILLDTVNVTVQ